MFTHKGIVKGCDARTPANYQYNVKLRESKNFWVTDKGTKYRKHSGSAVGKWPVYYLDINSIEKLEA